MELRKTFVKNLRKFRKARGISQTKLADLLDSATGYIGQIEIGRKFPSVEMIQRIAEALQIKPYLLFLDEDEAGTAASTVAPLPVEHIMNDKDKDELIRKLESAVRRVVEKA
jgi:transcriptional regulator with XRE-family HTH domain